MLHDNSLLEFQFEDVYGIERGDIWLEKCNCDVCKGDDVCICIDSSDTEYGPGCICKSCAEKAFNKKIIE